MLNVAMNVIIRQTCHFKQSRKSSKIKYWPFNQLFEQEISPIKAENSFKPISLSGASTSPLFLKVAPLNTPATKLASPLVCA